MENCHIGRILSAINSIKNPRVLEWGIGGSTVELSKHAGEWIGLETSPKWAHSVALAARNATIICFDQGIPTDPEHIYQDELKKLPLNEYVDWPKANGVFDIIIVDGRKRARCMEVARSVLADGGTIFLHDAIRTYYWDACVGLNKIVHVDERGNELWEMSK